jgi:hypothetical protein
LFIEEGQTHLEKAMEFYDEVLMHITNGGLPLENNDARTYRHVRGKTIVLLYGYIDYFDDQ